MTNLNKKRLFLTTLLSSAVIGFAAAPTMAQTAEDEIVVTGSRIKKKDFTSNAPVATVEAAQFERTGSVNTENLLNTLPQTVPGLDRTSNNPGNGSATVNLRGLGSNRTLVLVNGIRQVPFGQDGVVDLNTIPTALIRNVEVLTGGASSVYGADAVAGVVNFIYNDSFEGVQLDLGTQLTQQGDAGLYNAGITMGANLDGGRGNVAFNANYTSREPLFQGDRDFSTFAQFDSGPGETINGGSSGVPGTAIFSAFDFGFDVPETAQFGGPTLAPIYFDADGNAVPFRFSLASENDFYNYAPVNYIQLPQERFATTALGRYEINNFAEAYGRISFSSNKVDSQLAPTPIFQPGTQFSLDGNPFLTAGTQQLISDAIGDGVDTDGDGIDDTATGFVRRRLLEVGPRETKDDNQAFQVVAGVRGDVWFTDNWDYDVYLSEGRTLRAQQQNGNVNRGRFGQALLLADADGDGNVDVAADGSVTCADPSSNGSTTACAPINIFGEGNMSAAGAAFINTAVASRSTYEQTVVGANFTGDLGDFTIGGREIGAAFGFEYIENEAAFDPSQDLAASTIAGFNGSPASGGDYDVWSVYGEASIPVLADLPFAESVTVDVAARLSDYSTVGKANTYKVEGNWAVNNQMTFRGSYNTAVRAPNISELFAPSGEGFPGATDPCSAAANGGSGPTAAQAAICLATGVPQANLGSAIINTVSGQVRQLSGGNPDLQVEDATTFTVGAVFRPDFVEGLTLSVDYYDIEIQDAISSFGGGANNVLSVCYSADGGAGSPFCDVITRRGDGSINFISVQDQNVAEVTNKGVDVQATYSMETADLFGTDFGGLSFRYLGTYNIENDFVAFEGADPITCAGEFGADCGEPDPEYRHRMTGIWDTDAFSTQLVWRMVGAVDDDQGPGGASIDSIDAFHYFDGSSTWDVSDNLSFTLGINNLFDEKPTILGDNQEQANTYPATYDVFGRTFFLNAKTRF